MRRNQKKIFQDIRNFAAGRVIGINRDEALVDEMMKCLLAKKHMIQHGVTLSTIDHNAVKAAYALYAERAQGVPGLPRTIALSGEVLTFIDQAFDEIDLVSPTADPVGDMYEAFIGSAIRGAEGQFFTPQNAAEWLVDAVAPTAGEKVIDPACGAGGFLVLAAQRSGKNANLFGIEKDEYLASLARSRMAVLGGARSTIHCANSLSFETLEGKYLRREDFVEQFDIVLTNPPFGKNIVSASEEVRREFALGHRWKRGSTGQYMPSDVLASKAPPQVLFVERILSLLKIGGRAGLVLPESVLSNRSYAHVVEFIKNHANVKAVIGMPENLFKHSGKGGTHTKTALLVLEKGRPQKAIYMAEAKWCGNDSRGRSIEKDDLPGLRDEYNSWRTGETLKKGFEVDSKSISHNILAPRYHEPAGAAATKHLQESHELVTIGQLIEEGVLAVSTGDEVGKMSYGTGTVPFVRTSDISSWEVKIDPKHLVSDAIYEQYRKRQDVRAEDVLMVRDGTYLIGSCAIVTKYDTRIVYQSHILKFRCLNRERINPYLLLAMLSSIPVQRQIKSKTFTQDIIDSLGSRFSEITLPIPKSIDDRNHVIELVQKSVEDRIEAREVARMAKLLVAPPLENVELAELEIAANQLD